MPNEIAKVCELSDTKCQHNKFFISFVKCYFSSIWPKCSTLGKDGCQAMHALPDIGVLLVIATLGKDHTINFSSTKRSLSSTIFRALLPNARHSAKMDAKQCICTTGHRCFVSDCNTQQRPHNKFFISKTVFVECYFSGTRPDCLTLGKDLNEKNPKKIGIFFSRALVSQRSPISIKVASHDTFCAIFMDKRSVGFTLNP